ncbi:MAG: hypothetical protein AB7S38_35415 [Vulcanimicrobiota bacterium]
MEQLPMGLDATVMCRCYQDGLCQPFPGAFFDEEGYLTVPEGDFAAFDDWLSSACPHPGMELVCERVSNWAGYRCFQQALGRTGWENYPTLAEHLPNANGGQLPARAARAALEELLYFRDLPEVGLNVCLFETASDEVIQERVVGYDGKFVLGGRTGYDIGLDNETVFIERRETGEVVFQAARVGQKVKTDRNGEVVSAELTDLGSGTVWRGPLAIPGFVRQIGKLWRSTYPEALHVERRLEVPADYAYATDALVRLFEASIQTSNPVRWC